MNRTAGGRLIEKISCNPATDYRPMKIRGVVPAPADPQSRATGGGSKERDLSCSDFFQLWL
jgi:hypothetical protein